MCARVCVYVCVCACVRARACARLSALTPTAGGSLPSVVTVQSKAGRFCLLKFAFVHLWCLLVFEASTPPPSPFSGR